MKAVLFDLDGTLLPMDQDVFTSQYFKALCENMSMHGYEPKGLVDAVWKAVSAMLKNNGSDTNESVFWRSFSQVYGQRVYGDIHLFDDFYKTDFNKLKAVCGYTDKASAVVKDFSARGYKSVLASNPIFPLTAHVNRLKWAGLDERDFCHITSYENSHYCKPQVGYYSEILREINCDAKDCIMVGNDVSDDMSAQRLGMNVFLLTDCLINAKNEDISKYPSGGFDELVKYIGSL